MAFLIDESQKKTTKKDWLDLAQFLKVVFWFVCSLLVNGSYGYL